MAELTLDVARTILDAALAKAGALKLKPLVIAILDARGALKLTAAQDPKAASGYVRQDYAIALAKKAGFEYVGESEINANPKDTKDHPFGVWTLPPVRQSAEKGENPNFDHTKYDAIGESDRMTLRFRKPA